MAPRVARKAGARAPLKPPSPTRQIAFQQALVGARRSWLRDALLEAAKTVDLARLDTELHEFAPAAGLRILAGVGIRGELAFPTPVLLAASPQLLGYYRLLLGRSQKEFYGRDGFGPFKPMERTGRPVTTSQSARLAEVSRALGESLGELVTQIAPAVSQRDLDELPLLTLGAQVRGANNNEIGKVAAESVFMAIKELVEPHITEQTASRIGLLNSARRRVVITLGHDPDVTIDEEGKRTTARKVAVEIKGGTDKSNAHNRIGEAEKSHQKARDSGYVDFWTIITLAGLRVATLRQESPTTRSFFDYASIAGRQGPEWDTFRDALASVVGIPLRRKGSTRKQR